MNTKDEARARLATAKMAVEIDAQELAEVCDALDAQASRLRDWSYGIANTEAAIRFAARSERLRELSFRLRHGGE